MSLSIEQKNRILAIYYQEWIPLKREEWKPIREYLKIRIKKGPDGEEFNKCYLNSKGREVAHLLLQKLGKPSPVSEGVSIQKRTWHSVNQFGEHRRKDIKDSFREILSHGKCIFWIKQIKKDRYRIDIQGVENAISTVSSKIEWEKKKDPERLEKICPDDQLLPALKWVWGYLDDPKTRENLNDNFTEIIIW